MPGLKPDDPPEPAAVTVHVRIPLGVGIDRAWTQRERIQPGMKGLKRIQARHPVGHRRLRLVAEPETQALHPGVSTEAPAADEQGRPGADGHFLGNLAFELGLKDRRHAPEA